MFNSVLIDVGIGVALVFFTVAALVAALNEVVTRALDVRAKVLWKALANLIDRTGGGRPFTIGLWESLRVFKGADHDLRPVVMVSAGGGTGSSRRERGGGSSGGGPSSRGMSIDDARVGDRIDGDPIDADPGYGESADSNRLSARLANTVLVRSLDDTSRYFSKQRTKVDSIAPGTFAAALLEVTQEDKRAVVGHLAQARAALQASRTDAPPAAVIRDWQEARAPGTLKRVLAEAGLDPELALPIARTAAKWADAAGGGEPVTAIGVVGMEDALEAGIAAAGKELYANQLTDLRLLVGGTPLGAVVESALARTGGTVGAASPGAASLDASALDGVLHAVSDWFDQQMGQLSQHYKQAARKVLFVAGIVLAVAFNLSAIDLVQDLKANAEGRELLVSAVTSTCAAGVGQDDCLNGLDSQLSTLDASLTLPVVGQYAAPWVALRGQSGSPAERPWWQVVGGWALTGLAVSFGAPFWFGVMQRLSSYRSTAK